MKRLIPWMLLGISIHAQPWPVRIDVVDSNGRPIAGASVAYTHRDGRVLTTGPKGNVDIETEAERIAISKYGYLTVLFSRSE